MKAFVKCCVILALLAVVASGASASVVGYVHEPPFVPQRTMLWTFWNSQAWQTPITTVGPTWDSNTQEYGDWTCDNVSVSDEVRWYDTSANWAGHQGMIGLDNSQGQIGQTVSVTFHINNYATQNALKKLWFEGSLVTWGSVMGTVDYRLPDGFSCEVLPDYYDDLNPGQRADALWLITPNPSWEEMTWTAYVPAGGGILLDNIYVSTACVPEPSALMALGGSLAGMLGLAWRRRRA
jgi:hypothetical protein